MTDAQEPPDDRYCDLVMKGGITSGVVYPKAIDLLSHRYRFKSIGGTSAGAIAAVVTAAAEYQRRSTGSRAGFDLLANLPTELQREVAPGTSKLLSLFQPQWEMRRLFSVLIKTLNSKGTYRRIAHIVAGFLQAYWPATLAASVMALAVGVFDLGWLAAVLTLAVTLPLLIGLWVYADVTRQLVSNDLGLCTGLTEDGGNEALTPWLHTLIQKAAGRRPGDELLTFGDLWNAPGFPPPWLKLPADPKLRRSIDLQMFSTNLSHGRPYIFPLPERNPPPTKYPDRERLYFREEEMKRCLPTDVVAWMVKHSQPYGVEPGREGKDPPTEAADGRRELPEPRDFPVLLAARMSLSFPFLFTAVPLYAIDYDPPKERTFRRCWFSDGGISSNFPMHLFDGLVPMWPTFGITLEPEIKGRDMVFLPEKYDQGYGERWNRFGEQEGASKLGGFISAIVGTMQNWNDNSLARMPGVRDRVARVRLKEDEGGMNLNMEAALIGNIAERGVEATEELLRRFAPSPAGGQAEGWDEHRFVRLHVLLKMIAARSAGIIGALSHTCGHATDFSTLLDKVMNAKDKRGNPLPPPGYEEPMTQQERKALQQALEALGRLAASMTTTDQPLPFKSIPNPELRVRPPL